MDIKLKEKLQKILNDCENVDTKPEYVKDIERLLELENSIIKAHDE